ncbi:MAG: Por secretion system protein [Prevotella sp.]|nr:Por secretion system protein [Prevotella sp.]
MICCHLSKAQVGTWRNYLSYHEIQQIQAAGDDIFVMASNGLYQYNKQDQSIYTYDKTKGLSDTEISNIKWCPQAKRLVVCYNNSNIDLVETSGNVINISDIYTKAITGGKTIYSIAINGVYAYLACEYGITKINVKEAEVSESYMLNFPVTAIAFEGNTIYAKSQNNSIWKGSMNHNLIDPNNWEQTTDAPSFEEDKTDYNTYYPIVSTLQPGGPKYNYFDFLKFSNGKLYTCGGKHYDYVLSQRKGTIQVYDNENWTIFQDDLDAITGFEYKDITSFDIDPRDNNRVFASSSHSGLYEFYNGKLVKYYNADNSILYPVGGDKNMLLTDGVIFDKNANLWILSGWSKSNLVEITSENKWVNYFEQHSFLQENRNKLGNPTRPIIDSNNRLWFVNGYWEYPAILCYDINNNDIKTYANFKNQDGIVYNYSYNYCIKEDHDKNLWIGTEVGPFMLENSQIGASNYYFTQIKVPRNDGTDYADYLLNYIPISDICIDGANRKWFATKNNGVYVISADNMSQLYHFTTNNSCLLSNDVESIAINNETGEVFFGTDKGLCSYISDATEPNTEMTKDNVWAYPNPVNPDYQGPITVTGLTLNADVKILSSNGKLIAEGRSNGGTFIWDGCDSSGNRVASGVYMVATATKEGQKGTVCKIAIIR